VERPPIDRPAHGAAIRVAIADGANVHAQTSDDVGALDDAIFYVGSIAKQFVAACVAILERDGALELGDPVARYVPRLPAWG
jgi:CubicO group peptidase (beta-lactamase class C family)